MNESKTLQPSRASRISKISYAKLERQGQDISNVQRTCSRYFFSRWNEWTPGLDEYTLSSDATVVESPFTAQILRSLNIPCVVSGVVPLSESSPLFDGKVETWSSVVGCFEDVRHDTWLFCIACMPISLILHSAIMMCLLQGSLDRFINGFLCSRSFPSFLSSVVIV